MLDVPLFLLFWVLASFCQSALLSADNEFCCFGSIRAKQDIPFAYHCHVLRPTSASDMAETFINSVAAGNRNGTAPYLVGCPDGVFKGAIISRWAVANSDRVPLSRTSRISLSCRLPTNQGRIVVRSPDEGSLAPWGIWGIDILTPPALHGWEAQCTPNRSSSRFVKTSDEILCSNPSMSTPNFFTRPTSRLLWGTRPSHSSSLSLPLPQAFSNSQRRRSKRHNLSQKEQNKTLPFLWVSRRFSSDEQGQINKLVKP